MRRHSTVGDNKRTLWFILNPNTYAHKFGQTTTTRNPTSSSISRLNSGRWIIISFPENYMLNLHSELTFDFDFICYNFKLPYQILSCYQLTWLYRFTCCCVSFDVFSWPGGTRGRWYGVVFSSLGDRWEQTSFEDVPWKKKTWAAYVESRIRIRNGQVYEHLDLNLRSCFASFVLSWCSIWMCEEFVYFLGPPRFWTHFPQMFRPLKNDRI